MPRTLYPAALAWQSDERCCLSRPDERWQQFTGRPAAADAGPGWLELVPEEHRQPLLSEYAACWRREAPLDVTFPMQRVDGRLRIMRLWAVVRRHSEAAYHGMLFDVTAQQQAAQARDKWHRGLDQARHAAVRLLSREESHEQRDTIAMISDVYVALDGLMEASPNGMMLFDRQGRLLRANAALAAITGQRDPPRGRLVQEVFTASGTTLANRIADAAVDSLPATLEVHEPGFALGDHFLVQLFPVRTPERGLLGVGASLIDISASKRVEHALREANALKDQVLGLASHELRTPLTIVSYYANRIRKRQRTAAGREEADELLAATRRLHDAVNNMLMLARLDHDTVAPEPVSLAPMIEAAVRERLDERPVELDLPADLPPVAAVDARVWLVLENLLSNALKYTPEGSPIRVEAREDEGFVEVGVLDRGPGLLPAEVDSLFDPFVRGAQASTAIAGSGLGLAVCRRVLAAMGGEIVARPRDGGGAEFVFSLPVAA